MLCNIKKLIHIKCQSLCNSSCKVLYFYLFVRFVIISFFFFIHKSFSIDTTEALYWGQEWQLGYPKHPPLFAWIAEAWMFLCHNNLFLYNSLSALLTTIGIFASFLLFDALVVNRRLAILSAILLDGATFYNWAHQGINANTILYPIWPAICLTCFKAVEKNELKYWLHFGFFSGLGTLGKYNSIIIIFLCCLFILFSKEGRQTLATYKPYTSFLVFVVIMLPHLHYVMIHNFNSIEYIFVNSKATSIGLQNKLLNLLKWFSSVFILNIAPMLLAIIALSIGKHKKNKVDYDTFFINRNAKSITYFVFFGSVIFWVLYTFLFTKPRTAWFSPNYFILPVLLISFVQKYILETRITATIYFIFIVTIVSTFFAELTSSSFFQDGREERRVLSESIITQWRDKYNECPRYTTYKDITIYGRNLCGHKIHMILDYKITNNPWPLDINDIKKYGILMINENDENNVEEIENLLGKAKFITSHNCQQNTLNGRTKCDYRKISFYHR